MIVGYLTNYPKHELDIQKNLSAYKENSISRTKLLDWKYMDLDSFISFNKKIEMDVTKQLCYEFSLKKLKSDTSIESQFVIPWFYNTPNSDIGDFIDAAILHQRLRDNKLQVFKACFSQIQAVYLSHD